MRLGLFEFHHFYKLLLHGYYFCLNVFLVLDTNQHATGIKAEWLLAPCLICHFDLSCHGDRKYDRPVNQIRENTWQKELSRTK